MAFELNEVIAHEYGFEKCFWPAVVQSDYHLRSFFLFFLLILRRSIKATFKENINKSKSSAAHRATSKTAPVYDISFFTLPSPLLEHLEE